ncbi:MAG: AAA family ATPase [Acidobacteria bacterium]|nr:AAA family ATPase [Acidobacteriota bacterium]
MQITLPDVSLVLLIGVSGSGKSTFARQHFAPTEIVSSDHCRALICDDENNQTVNQDAFELLHLIATKRLAHRKLTVIDATNVQSQARQFLLGVAAAAQIPAVAIVLNVESTIAFQQNEQRSHRIVDQEVILQQQQDLQAALANLSQEGFHSIYVLTTPTEIAATSILREIIH